MPESSLPPKPPTSSSGTGYIVAAIVLGAAIVALVFFKVRGCNQDASPLPMASTPVAPTPTFVEPPPPPPPPVVEETAPEAGVTHTAVGTYVPCSGKCAGSGNSALNMAISARAGAARPCYERALRLNSALQGKLMVSVRVDPQGNVCGTSVAQDGIHSPEVANCVLGMFRSAKFPAPSGGCLEVQVPLSFVPRESK
ncbi:MAG TPA: AgmX/PglI C-terminal domain-containing protein [Polyangiaceae bacterium]|jgi:outer membrane biosynthesis protein TonB